MKDHKQKMAEVSKIATLLSRAQADDKGLL